MDYREENNYPKAFLATGIILGLVMALCYFLVFHNPPPNEEGTGGILVNYGTVDEGMGSNYMSTEEPSVAEKANNTKPDKVTPAPPTEEKQQVENSDKNVVTQSTDDAPEVAANTTKPSTSVATQPTTKTVTKPAVNQNALYKGKTNNGTGEGDGTGSSPGNQGKPTGTTLTNNYNGTGDGNGGTALTARNFTRPPSKPVVTNFEGKIVITFKIDTDGNIISASVARGSTSIEGDIVDKCIQAVKNAKVNPSANVSEDRTYTQTFVFKRQ
ncbi:TonB family protein [Mucilaginibacter sp. RB4R14]|uniref:energy transducer TonB family protein n=1 Tax=Mucilaginibacter aurantiaciroseus TaxID=2949308 RepID=UPI0020908091|nr:TonB family protein [Mucilaginibacter aurantiaciroseus]MCO5934256.1 TonB family protein [Mucilaginibacter aurantiaciroseus]